MLKTQPLVDWTNGLALPLTIPFIAGPDIREYGKGDRAGSVTKVPGGGGLLREQTFEQVQVQWFFRSRIGEYALLEDTAEALDNALRAIQNELLWGTYVRFVQRLGTLTPEADEPEERVSFVGNYLIEIGL